MTRRRLAAAALALSLVPLCGCGDALLERSYTTRTPHSAAYWESEEPDTLRAENYHELVTALMLLLGEHASEGVVRVYDPDAAEMAGQACNEVQHETAMGTYLLDYIAYTGEEDGDAYALSVRFGYRRSAAEQGELISATSTQALPDLLRAAVSEGRARVAIRFGYFTTDRAGVIDMVRTVYEEFFPLGPEEPVMFEALPEPGEADEAPPEEAEAPPEPEEPEIGAAETAPGPEDAEDGADSPAEEEERVDGTVGDWRVFFYPDTDQPGIVEIDLAPGENAAVPAPSAIPAA